MKGIVSLSVCCSLAIVAVIGCAGVKAINPNDQSEDAGTLALDLTNGSAKLVTTYTCKMRSMGHRFSAVNKSEEEARQEVLARCRDKTILSFCSSEQVTCFKN